MRRRGFLAAGAAAMVAGRAGAATGVAYAEGMIEAELKAGRVVFVDFHATWCTTCRAQSRIIEKLVGEKPEYLEKVRFIVVDWDRWQGSDLARRLNVQQRATLIALSGDKELGRVVFETREEKIRALMEAAVAAAG